MKKKILVAVLAVSMAFCSIMSNNVIPSVVVEAAVTDSLVYSNNFEKGIGDGCTIVGSGELETTTDSHGTVFHNAKGGQAERTNYLLLPANILVDAVKVKGELTVSMDVNVGTATDYFYTPLFSAYGAAPESGANTFPMMIIQSRGLIQVNCNGWSDFTNNQNVNSTNEESTVYLDDKAWHNVTVTYTKSGAKFYVDGTVVNEWTLDGGEGSTLDGFLSEEGASQLKYICLGGNQAWDWQDPDAAYLLDNVGIYSSALTNDEIKEIINANTNGTTTPPADDTQTPDTTNPPADDNQNQAPDTTEPVDDNEDNEPEAAEPTLSKKKLTVKVGKSKTLKVNDAEGTVKWSSNKKKVAKVNKNGKITGVKAGKATITAKVDGKTLKCKVTVKK